MFVASLCLMGVAVAISAIALGIAIYHDLGNARRLHQSRENAEADRRNVAHYDIRLWDAPSTSLPFRPLDPRLDSMRIPDIITGKESAAAGRHAVPERRRAA
ncbi:MAG: hypothetical protein KF861_16700 [Planctomycetaceae bacterium]|nr:hypothetical protein [Planctomycetaceae bacterium]